MKRILCFALLTLLLLTAVSCVTEPPVDDTPKYVFQSGNAEIAIDAEAEAILTALGTAVDYSESPSCAFEGLDKIYIYAGFRVQTYSKNGKDYIRAVELTDDSVKTPEGIAIGATQAEVTAAYGEASTEDTAKALYRDAAKGMYLQFLFRDGRVTSIQYQKDVA